MTNTNRFERNQLAVAVLDASPDAVVLVDLSGSIRYVNQRACELFKFDRHELIDRPVEVLLPDGARSAHVRLRERYVERPVLRPMGTGLDLHGQRKDGSRFPAEISIGPIDVDDRTWIVCTVRDITAHRDIESRLRSSEILLLEAQRLARLGSWHWDLATGEITWSDEVYRIFGWETVQPLRLEAILEALHPEDRPALIDALEKARLNGTPFEIEYRLPATPSGQRHVVSNGVLYRDDRGRPVSLIGTAQDITDRRASERQAIQLAVEQAARAEAERMRERFEFLAQVSSTLAATLDFQETLERFAELLIPRLADWVTVNLLATEDEEIERAAMRHRTPDGQRILEEIRNRGFIPDLSSDHPLAVAMRENQPQLHRSVVPEMLRSMARNEEHLSLSLALAPCSVILAPLVARGRAYGVLTLGMSVSGRQYDDDDFALALEVARRAAIAIDNANLFRASQQAARVREEFVSLVSHELKTPLTVIKGHVQILDRYLRGASWDRDKITQLRERLETQTNRLELLISDILDVSRIQQGRLDLRLEDGVDLVELVTSFLAHFEDTPDRSEKHLLVLDAAEPVVGSFDRLRLDQVLSNLITNAVKYSPRGGEVRISVRRVGDDAEITVKDQGVGIRKEDQESIFQPFQRGEAASRGITGTGLGLYISRQIVEQHGGTISVASRPGKGSTFTVRLPIRMPVRPDADPSVLAAGE
jgi:PAS domain S-box-containing protein